MVVQWFRTHPPVQGTRVPALVQEESTCLGVTKHVCHDYRTLQPMLYVNCKLALTKSIANYRTTKAFAVCLYGD